MFNDYNDLLTVYELCQMLITGKNAAYKILNSGNIRAFRVGRTWKIPKKSVEKYILEKSYL